ncbi:MAG: PcfJ domain-containing protein [Thiolinea sp.]
MKTVLAREMIKNRFRKLTEEQARQYHLTHNYYNGRPFRTPYQVRERLPDPETQMARQNLDSLNALLYPHPKLEQALSGVLAALRRTPERVEPTVEIALKPSADWLRRATEWYERYRAEGVTTLLAEQESRLSEANVAIIRRALPNQTVMAQNICMLAEFWVRTPADWQANGATGLLEHLFVHYPVPGFLKIGWNRTANPHNLQWLLVYLAYAQGGSLKQLAQYFAWPVASQKLWHLLTESRPGLTPQQAVMYTEIRRLGAWEFLFDLVAEHPAYRLDLLGSAHSDSVAFWYGTVQWLIRHQAELSDTEIRRILVWARHRYTEAAREQQVFSLTGRSLDKVVRKATAYHRAVLAQQAELRRRAEARRLAALERQRAREQELEEQRREALDAYREFYSWQARGWDWELKQGPHNCWQFVELTSSRILDAEGEAMQHCVGSYDYYCYSGEAVVFSLRYNNQRCVTLELEPDSGDVVQVYGYANRDANEREQRVIAQWLQRVVNRARKTHHRHHRQRR